MSKWQREYCLPPRPDGKVHTTFRELLDTWEAEDSVLTLEQVVEQNGLRDDWNRDRTGVGV